jgi:hypothetical protein
MQPAGPLDAVSVTGPSGNLSSYVRTRGIEARLPAVMPLFGQLMKLQGQRGFSWEVA